MASAFGLGQKLSCEASKGARRPPSFCTPQNFTNRQCLPNVRGNCCREDVQMIGVISDDLTGAAELGAVGLRNGLAAEIVAAGEPSGQADLVCMDTSSRSCPPEEAARRVAAAARTLNGAGAKWIY